MSQIDKIRKVWITREASDTMNSDGDYISFIVSDDDIQWWNAQEKEFPSSTCAVLYYHAWFLDEVEVIDGEFVVWNGDKYELHADGSGIRISDVPV